MHENPLYTHKKSQNPVKLDIMQIQNACGTKIITESMNIT